MANKKWTAWQWFMVVAVFAFGSIISAFQVNSAWSDAHNFNGLFGWIGVSIVLGLIALYLLIVKVVIKSNTEPQEK